MTWRRFVPGLVVAEVVLAVVAAAAGALVYQGFFTTPGHLLALGFACLIGGVTAALGHRRLWSVAVLTVLGPVLVVVFGVFRGDSSLALGSLRGSWNRLLTVVVPVEPWDELLTVPALATWAAAFTAVLLVLRTRNVLAPLAPPLAGFLFALVVAGNQTGGHATATVVFLSAALPLIAVRAHRSTGTVRVEGQSPRSIAALATAALLVVVSALLGVAGGQALPLASGEHRFDPRDRLAPAITSTDTVSPLSRVKGQLRETPARTLFTVRVARQDVDRIDRVRTAALDVFDGTTWKSRDEYRMAGSHLTADPAQTRGTPVTARIELNEFSGPYLPVIGWPSRLTADGQDRFGFDPGSGVVVGTSTNLSRLSYEVTGEVVVKPYHEELAQAVTTPNNAPDLPGGVPDALRELAARYTMPRPVDRLQVLLADLQDKPNQLNSPPGHSYAAVTRMMTDPANAGGFVEQHVSAFTLFARMWGYPARVAVGYRLGDHRDGLFEVSNLEAYAWSEVHFAEYGWVTFDPAFSVSRGALTPPPEVPRVAPPSPAAPATAAAAAPPASSPPAEAADGWGFGWTAVLRDTLLLVPALAVLLMVAGGFVIIAKAHRRRQRRTNPGHAARVLGAWHELLDRLTERGISPPLSFTFHEVADHVGDFGDTVRAAARLATTATYAPEDIGRPEADQAWHLTDRLRTELRSQHGRAAALLAAANPRPLWTRWSRARRLRTALEGLEKGLYR
ncbi:transglutaminase family protein [Lentzea sp. NPDC054927]